MNVISRRTALRWTCAGAAGLWLSRQGLADEPRIAIPAYNNLTDTQELELGERFAAQIDREQQIVKQPLIDSYLTGIVKDLAKGSQRPSLPYSIKLVNSMEINAFSLPGGFLYVNRGLVQRIRTENELVATLAHELGHVVGRHSVNQLLLKLQAKQLLDRTVQNLGKNNKAVEKIIQQLGGAVAVLALLRFSRQDELQADMLGFYEMLRAGWDPHGFLQLFKELEVVEHEAGAQQSEYLSTHPPTADRYAAVQRELTLVRIPANPRVDSLTFQAFRLAMSLLPDPPRRMPAKR